MKKKKSASCNDSQDRGEVIHCDLAAAVCIRAPSYSVFAIIGPSLALVVFMSLLLFCQLIYGDLALVDLRDGIDHFLRHGLLEQLPCHLHVVFDLPAMLLRRDDRHRQMRYAALTGCVLRDHS